jgi:hypothetical protein
MHARLVTLGLAGGIAAAAYPGSLAAQPAETPADVQFQQGRQLLVAGKYAEACAAFDASQALKPDIATLLNQANCREKNHQLATAWRLFVEAERQTHDATDPPTRELHRVAADRAAKLEARLSTLTIHVPDDRRIAGLEILLDGERIGPEAWSRARPVDGGTYHIAARAPGMTDWAVTVTVGVERDPTPIEVPALGAPALVPAPASPPAATAAPAPVVPRRSIWPLAFAGGAVVLLGGAGGLAWWGDRTYAQAEAAPDLDTQTAFWHSANRKRYAAQAMLGTGIGCAGVAVWLWLRGRSEASTAAAARHARTAITPLVDANTIGLGLGRSW